ncbi:hypothetical protein J6TS2_45060 [Heyndrickxia sporothermodurans]|nr:hypothetical protein J6TS2_45060 [Heyndrickxia sporothermodurans]
MDSLPDSVPIYSSFIFLQINSSLLISPICGEVDLKGGPLLRKNHMI